MKILHYSLGFPPYRTGGMTKFCVDLIKQQTVDGDQSAMLWPGRMGIINQETAIKEKGKVSGISSFEIINPLPVPYDEGICDFETFTAVGYEESYTNFLKDYLPDVIHIHTLMGLHRSLLEVSRSLNIRLVFSAHDFFPICPKVTMFRCGQVCRSAGDCSDCGQCNTTALSMSKIRVLQSPVYRLIKEVPIVRRLRKRHRDAYLNEGNMAAVNRAVGKAEDFQRLRDYYASLLRIMDVIHYNSSVTKLAYERFFKLPQAAVIGISHRDINDHRKRKDFRAHISFAYLGPQSSAKGFYLLKTVMDKLWEERQDFELNVYFQPVEPAPYIKPHPGYAYSELGAVMDNTDMLLVPSLWYETFGFTVLEALSYGVPVLMSGNVGAKDILAQGAGIVIDHMDKDNLFQVLKGITPEKLMKMNRAICENQEIMTLDKMAHEIKGQCYQRSSLQQ